MVGRESIITGKINEVYREEWITLFKIIRLLNNRVKIPDLIRIYYLVDFFVPPVFLRVVCFEVEDSSLTSISSGLPSGRIIQAIT